MKKLFISFLSILFSFGLFAQHQQEFGIVGGSLNGLSYKRIMSENFAIQTDLAVGFQRTIGATNYYFEESLIDMFDFTLNANFLYNKNLQNGLYTFIGGGSNLGLAKGLPYSSATLGKFGINAMLGAGYKMPKMPLSISLDFRPGYAILFQHYDVIPIHIFDWHLALGVRYCF